MIPYSIHVAIILAVCLVFYKLLLQKETYYRLNRVILLSCLALAFVLPLIPVPRQFSLVGSEVPVTSAKSPVVNPDNYQDELPMVNSDVPNVPVNETTVKAPATAKPGIVKQQSSIPAVKPAAPKVPLLQQVIKWAFWLYWCGVAAFGANLLLQIVVLLYQSYKKPAMLDGIYRIVELDDDKAPCSFGNSIFINPAKYDWETYNQILMHEKVHIQQRHTLDLVLAELMLVVQWFNPFAWLYRKELESNLEFLTDDSVLHHHRVEPAAYQLSLLKVSVPNFSMSIATNYNQSLLKKRIIMMNAKRSNIHTMWKYFMLMPLLVALVCGLNKPIAMSSPVTKFQQIFSKASRGSDIDFSHGTWFATIKGDKVYIQFQADDNDENHSWSSSRNFNLSDFPNLPKTEKADFTLTREAGSVLFNGKFDGDQGIGHYKFTPNKDYIAFMSKQNIDGLNDDEYFSFFMADVKKDYVQFLKDNGFKDIAKYQIMSMSSQKIDAAYIKYWKDLGYTDLTPQQLVSLKSQKVDAAYVNDIRKAGYTDLTVQQLISFKSQHITGDYINSLRKATVKVPGGSDADNKPTAREIISSKNMHIDSAYVAGIRGTGYAVNNYSQLSTLKAMNITPEYIKSFEAVGYKDIPPSTLYTMKSMEITPEYVKELKDMGYTDEELPRLISLKRNGITPEYIKSFAAVGYKNIPVNSLYGLTSGKITPADVKGYQAVGYGKVDDDNNAPAANAPNSGVGRKLGGRGMVLNEISSYKAQGITPEYIKGFQDIGYKDIPFGSFRTLKAEGITPEYIKGFQDAGYKDVPVNSLFVLKSVTPEYAKSMADAGYKNASLMQLSSLKRQGVTADYIQGFNKLGFTDIPVNQLGYLKMSGITPEFVTEMKQKGFDSKDLNKYIQLKNFNTSAQDFNAPRGSGGRKMATPAAQGQNN